MKAGFSPALRRLVDEGGMVRCPMRRLDIDYERCLSCSWLQGLETDNGLPVVVCDIRDTLLDVARMAVR